VKKLRRRGGRFANDLVAAPLKKGEKKESIGDAETHLRAQGFQVIKKDLSIL